VRDTELMIDQMTQNVVKSKVEINALIDRLSAIYHINYDELTPLEIPLWLVNLSSIMDSHRSTIDTIICHTYRSKV